MKTGVIIQSRMGSTRLPGKNLLPLLSTGETALDMIHDSCGMSGVCDEVVIACPAPDYDHFVHWAEVQRELTGRRFYVFGGSEDNVYRRTLDAARARQLDVIVDITGDCPLVPAGLVADMVTEFLEAQGVDYVSNVFPHRQVPDGMDIQVYTTAAMAACLPLLVCESHSGWNLWKLTEAHTVIPDLGRALHSRPFFVDENTGELRITLDTPQDYLLLKKIAPVFVEHRYCHNTTYLLDFLGFLLRQAPEYWDNREVRAKIAGEG